MSAEASRVEVTALVLRERQACVVRKVAGSPTLPRCELAAGEAPEAALRRLVADDLGLVLTSVGMLLAVRWEGGVRHEIYAVAASGDLLATAELCPAWSLPWKLAPSLPASILATVMWAVHEDEAARAAAAERAAVLRELGAVLAAMSATEPRRTLAYIRRHGWAPSQAVADAIVRLRQRPLPASPFDAVAPADAAPENDRAEVG